MTGRTDDTALIISLLQDILAVLEEIRTDLAAPDDEPDDEVDEDDARHTSAAVMAPGGRLTWAEPRGWARGEDARILYICVPRRRPPVPCAALSTASRCGRSVLTAELAHSRSSMTNWKADLDGSRRWAMTSHSWRASLNGGEKSRRAT